MKYFFSNLLASLALTISAAAQTMQVPVNPDHLEYSNFVFTVNTTATNDGTAFHLTITTKTQPIGSDCVGSLALVTSTNLGAVVAPVITGVKPSVRMAFNNTPLVWTIDFVASPALMNDPTADFIFVVPDYKIANNQRVNLPTDRIYEINLQSFLPIEPGRWLVGLISV